MEQNIQSPVPQAPKGIKYKITIAALITLIGVGAYFWMMINVDKNNRQQDTEVQNQPPLFFGNDRVSTEINPKDYSMARYPLEQSPIYSRVKTDCHGEYYPDSEDERLIKKGGDVIIQSLAQFFADKNNSKLSCDYWFNHGVEVEILSTPMDGKYLYLDVSNQDKLSGIYSLDLSNKEVKRLSFSDHIKDNTAHDPKSNYYNENYRLLSDEKRLIKWTPNDLYLVDLEADTVKLLYTTSHPYQKSQTVSQSQWLVSNIEFLPAENAIVNYDIKIEKNQVVVEVYDKDSKKSEDPKCSKNKECGYTISYTLIDSVIIPIPVN